MNLKRYIDAVVRREVRRAFFFDSTIDDVGHVLAESLVKFKQLHEIAPLESKGKIRKIINFISEMRKTARVGGNLMRQQIREQRTKREPQYPTLLRQEIEDDINEDWKSVERIFYSLPAETRQNPLAEKAHRQIIKMFAFF